MYSDNRESDSELLAERTEEKVNQFTNGHDLENPEEVRQVIYNMARAIVEAEARAK